MIETVKNLIKKILNKDIDDGILDYLYQNEVQSLLNQTNLKELPKELEHIAVERTIGAYINCNLSTLSDDADVQPVKSIHEGDTTVEFGESDKKAVLTSISNHFLRGRERELACYRIIKW